MSEHETTSSDSGERAAAQIAAHELSHDVAAARQMAAELRAGIDGERGTDIGALAARLERALERLDANIERLLIDGAGDLDTLRVEPTHLGNLVERVVDAHPAGDHPIEVDAAAVAINLDRTKVERILDNLLANALEHTPPGCAVRVRAHAEPGGARLVVEDDGPGLPAEVRDALQSTDAGAAADAGLWIVTRFARLHGGDVDYAYDPEAGAAVSVWLPARSRG